MDDPGQKPPDGRIERLGAETLKARLRRAARDLFPGRTIDDLELHHLMRVVMECAVHFQDVYSEDRIRRIMRPGGQLMRDLVDRLIEQQLHAEAGFSRVARLPDDVRRVGDKALFDHGLLGLREVKGYDLAELGARAYERAGEALELLAEDRRLQEFFKQNKLLVLPIEEEVVFLRQCSDRFRIYADLLQHTRGTGAEEAGSALSDLEHRVPLMAAAAEALRLDRHGPEAPRPPADPYVAAARGETAEPIATKEALLSRYERVLLFSALDMPRLQSALDGTVVDQDRAVAALCDEFSLFAAGTRDPSKPSAFFLVGPTGVGKNHLVESLRRMLEGVWRIEVPLLTIEGPSYTYPSDINELRGATRGFIRSDEEGLLAAFHARSSRAPLGILLIDEVEKAHPQLLTFFLSILDRGTTTDNRGNVLDFANCLVFFTSNLGYSDAQQGAAPIGYLDEQARHQASDQDVRRSLRGRLTPEFLNRVRVIHFDRLTEASAARILDLELERIARRYRELHGLRIELQACARAELIRRGFSPVYGARHLATTLESVCNVEIAKQLRRDDRGPEADRADLLSWLREIRAGERPFHDDEVRSRVRELARAHLPYQALRILFREDRFCYEPLREGEGE